MLLIAKAKPTPTGPPTAALMLPASVAIDSVSVASTATLPWALTAECELAPPLMCASTVFRIVLKANEPPSATPLPEPAPPSTTLTMRAFSLAATVTLPALELSVDESTPATTELRMSLMPIEALMAVPPPENPNAPVPA